MKAKIEPDSDKKVANRQISARGVQKDHFEWSIVSKSVLTPHFKFREISGLRYVKIGFQELFTYRNNY